MPYFWIGFSKYNNSNESLSFFNLFFNNFVCIVELSNETRILSALNKIEMCLYFLII